MHSTEHEFNSAQFAVLVEKVDTIARQSGRMENAIETLSERIAQRMNGQDEKLNGIAQTVAVHSQIWKIIGTGAVISAGAIGWLLNSINDLKMQGNAREARLAVIEYALKQNEAVRYQPQPGIK